MENSNKKFIVYFTMILTASAGGTGHVGKTILDVLSEDPEHTIIVLSRTVSFAVHTDKLFMKRLTICAGE